MTTVAATLVCDMFLREKVRAAVVADGVEAACQLVLVAADMCLHMLAADVFDFGSSPSVPADETAFFNGLGAHRRRHEPGRVVFAIIAFNVGRIRRIFHAECTCPTATRAPRELANAVVLLPGPGAASGLTVSSALAALTAESRRQELGSGFASSACPH